MTDCPPTFSRVPDGNEDLGNDCVELALAYGIGLDEWQREIIRGALRERDGTFSATQMCCCLARQNGKNQIQTAIELFGLFILGETILHTAHASRTSSDSFRRLWAVVRAHKDLERRVRKYSQAPGCEFIELEDDSRIAFTTRSASAGRGLAIDRLMIDECEDFPAAEVSAIQPTTFSRPNAQSMWFGTAPGPTHDSAAMENLRKTAIDGLNPRLAYWEWSLEYGSDVDDRDLWVSVNPAVACGRVSIDAIENDKSVLELDSFMAERLSMWVPHSAEMSLFSDADWDSLADPDSLPVDSIAIGVDTPPSRDSSTVCIAGKRADGRISVEWYRTEPGVAWVPSWVSERLNDRVRAVVIDERGALAECDWAGAKVRPTMIGSHDVAVAAGLLLDGISEQTLRHRGQVELSRGVLSAKQRPLGSMFAWDRKGSPGSSALIAASMAILGVTMVRPQRPRRSGDGRNGSSGRRGFVF